MALTTSASLFAQAGIVNPNAAQVAQANSFIAGVSDEVCRLLNRKIQQATYTEYYTGNNSPYLMLNQYPVSSISTICIDNNGYNGDAPNAFPSANNLVSGVDFTLTWGKKGQGATGIVRRINDVWPARPSRAIGTVSNLPPLDGSGNIKVVYVAGYAVVPPAITMAVNSLVLKLMNQAMIGGEASSMSYEDASVAFMGPEEVAKMVGSIKSVIGSYKSLVV